MDDGLRQVLVVVPLNITIHLEPQDCKDCTVLHTLLPLSTSSTRFKASSTAYHTAPASNESRFKIEATDYGK